jgi:hypothetical protein
MCLEKKDVETKMQIIFFFVVFWVGFVIENI